jgi:hypothetical protein
MCLPTSRRALAARAKIIGDAQERNVISAKTERSELKRRGILGPDF